MNIIGKRKIFYALSGVLLLASIAAVTLWGLRLGIDFSGGSIMDVEFLNSRPASGEIAERIGALNLGEVRLQPASARGLLIRTRHIDEAEHQAILQALGSEVRENRFDTVGPVIGKELQRRSLAAIFLVILLIVSYIAFAFRKVSDPATLGRAAGLAPWKYGMTTVVALVHDVIIPTGFFAVAGRFFGFEVDTLFVTAILTILGFSVHDTIVVFDRIRENLKKRSFPGDYQTLVNQSVNETLVRSINTSLTVVLALAAVYFFGGASTRVFSLTLIIGIIAGTYSSIFIASPLLVTWHQLQRKKPA